jgi:hypothetical protein
MITATLNTVREVLKLIDRLRLGGLEHKAPPNDFGQDAPTILLDTGLSSTNPSSDSLVFYHSQVGLAGSAWARLGPKHLVHSDSCQ